MTRKLKEIDIAEPKKVKRQKKQKSPEPVLETIKEEPIVENVKTKNPPTEKQIAARERARVAREEKKQKEIDDLKQQAVEEALKQKAIDDKKASKASERKAKKAAVEEKKVVEEKVQEPIASTPIVEFKDEPKEKLSFVTPPNAIPVEIKPIVENKPSGIFAKRETDFTRGVKKGTVFGSSSFVRRLM